MDLQGSKTQQNLAAAFAGESQARNKYSFFASTAKKEGFEQIAAIFTETAEEEKQHAKLLLRLLGGVGETAANLQAAASGENKEWTDMYPTMAKTAREEGFEDIARLFDGLGKIEKEHEARYAKLLKSFQDGALFSKPAKVKWHCRECGFVCESAKAPPQCPICKHPQSYFEMAADNF